MNNRVITQETYQSLKSLWFLTFRTAYQSESKRIGPLEASHRGVSLANYVVWQRGKTLRLDVQLIADLLILFNVKLCNWNDDPLISIQRDQYFDGTFQRRTLSIRYPLPR